MAAGLPGLAGAGIGGADSAPGPLDARNPELTLPVFPIGLTYRGGETALFAWTFGDLHPATGGAADVARVLVDGAALDSLAAPAVSGPAQWAWPVPELNSGLCYLTVAAIDSFGNRTAATTARFSILASATGAPPTLADGPVVLRTPHPNPFNPSTRLAWALTAPGTVQLALYDPRGRRVRVVAEGPREAGDYATTWNGDDDHGRRVAAGTYLLRLTWRGAAGRAERTTKVVMVP
ncbi:MAG: FlgD immunoglobulin-like domain containing protein [Candidatus Krumholzibacteriia bacterium]